MWLFLLLGVKQRLVIECLGKNLLLFLLLGHLDRVIRHRLDTTLGHSLAFTHPNLHWLTLGISDANRVSLKHFREFLGCAEQDVVVVEENLDVLHELAVLHVRSHQGLLDVLEQLVRHVELGLQGFDSLCQLVNALLNRLAVEVAQRLVGRVFSRIWVCHLQINWHDRLLGWGFVLNTLVVHGPGLCNLC